MDDDILNESKLADLYENIDILEDELGDDIINMYSTRQNTMRNTERLV